MIYTNIFGTWVEASSVLAVQPVFGNIRTVRVHLKSGQFVSIKFPDDADLKLEAHAILKKLLAALNGENR